MSLKITAEAIEPERNSTEFNQQTRWLAAETAPTSTIPEYLTPRGVTPVWMLSMFTYFMQLADKGALTYTHIEAVLMNSLGSEEISLMERLDAALYLCQEIQLTQMRGRKDDMSETIDSLLNDWIASAKSEIFAEIELGSNTYIQLLLQETDNHWKGRKELELPALLELRDMLWQEVNNSELTPNNRLAILATVSWIEVKHGNDSESFLFTSFGPVLDELVKLDPTNIGLIRPYSRDFNQYSRKLVGELNDENIAADYANHPAPYDLSRESLNKKFGANLLNIVTNLIIILGIPEDQKSQYYQLMQQYVIKGLEMYGNGGTKLLLGSLIVDIEENSQSEDSGSKEKGIQFLRDSLRAFRIRTTEV